MQVVVIDERFELMLIFWSTMAVFTSQFGGALKKSFTDQIDQVRGCVGMTWRALRMLASCGVD